MSNSDITESAVTVEESSLSNLHYWLQFKKHTWIIGAVIIWLPYHIILTGISILAAVFTPFMLWHLFKAKWYKAVTTFCAIVILPFLILHFLQIGNPLTSLLTGVLTLVTFYFYTYVISYMIGEYLGELKAVRRWEKENLANTKSLR